VTQDYTAADLPELEKHAGAFTVYNTPGFDIEHLEFNVDPTYNGKTNPLANTNVRLGLGLALDKMTLIESALGVNAAEAKQIIAWTPWVNTPKLVQPFADKSITGQWDPIVGKYVQPGTSQALTDAKALLARTPWKNGFSLSLSTTAGNPTRAAQEAVVANSWRKIGVQVTPNYVPASKLFAGYTQAGPLNQGQFQVAMFAFTGSPEPDSFKYELASKYIDRDQSTHSAINENYSGIKDPSIDQAFSAASGTFDNSVRTKNYDYVQERLTKQSYWITLYFRPQIATADSNVQNFSDNPTQLGPTWDVYAWKTARVA
jgi:peptide/nickel transport system substrate-binding protein